MTMTTESDVSGEMGPAAEPPPDETGEWLVAHRWAMDRGELVWLEALADFDREQGWAADGQFSCVGWLMWRTQMARATAYEKLRIAHELRRRPLVRDAFAAGRLSYSAVRVLTRLEGPDPDVDAALIDLAQAGTIMDLERAACVYRRYWDQDRPPPPIADRRGLHITPRGDGSAVVEITLEASEAQELATALQAVMDHQAVDESPAGDNTEGAADDLAAGADTGRAVDESPVGDSPGGLAGWRSWPQVQVDAFMDLVRIGRHHAGAGHAGGDDRYLVHVVRYASHDQLMDGTVLDGGRAQRLACDAARVVHVVTTTGEPLRLGRKTRDWSTAQRRAITLRDGGRCRFPGCQHRHVDIHHLRFWEHGGPTDIENGISACPRHHSLLHGGFTASGNANGIVTFHRPGGAALGTTSPQRAVACPSSSPAPAVPPRAAA
jgi:hypothetical protein